MGAFKGDLWQKLESFQTSKNPKQKKYYLICVLGCFKQFIFSSKNYFVLELGGWENGTLPTLLTKNPKKPNYGGSIDNWLHSLMKYQSTIHVGCISFHLWTVAMQILFLHILFNGCQRSGMSQIKDLYLIAIIPCGNYQKRQSLFWKYCDRVFSTVKWN